MRLRPHSAAYLSRYGRCPVVKSTNQCGPLVNTPDLTSLLLVKTQLVPVTTPTLLQVASLAHFSSPTPTGWPAALTRVSPLLPGLNTTQQDR